MERKGCEGCLCSNVPCCIFSLLFYVYFRCDGHGAKTWQSTDAGIQSHVLKAVAAFVASLSNEALKRAPMKVIFVQPFAPCSAIVLHIQ
jgi:hypothetical protein